MGIPIDESENDRITLIGEQFYDQCEAKSQSGKTLWIGIERDQDGDWSVRRFLKCLYYLLGLL